MYVCYFIHNKLYTGMYDLGRFILYEEHKDLFTDFIKLIDEYKDYISCFIDNVDRLQYDRIIYPLSIEQLWKSKYFSKIICYLISRYNLRELTNTTIKINYYISHKVHEIGWDTISRYAHKELIKRTINKYPWNLEILFEQRMEFNKIFKYYLLSNVDIYMENKLFMNYILRVDKNRKLRKDLILQDICKKVDLSNKACYKLLFSLSINYNKNLTKIGDIRKIYNLFEGHYK